MKILVVDDHQETRELLSRSLSEKGHAVEAAGSCAEAEAALGRGAPDVVVLDVMLGDGSGLALCRALREGGQSVPVLLLTARGDVRDRVDGLDAGADDYLAKPFALSELHARVRALGRRGPALRRFVLRIEDLTIDIERRSVERGGKPVPLTARELAILEVLALRRGSIVPRDELVEAVWGEVSESAKASLEVLMGRLRRKLGGPAAPIRTVRGLGYVLDGGTAET